MLRVKCKMTVKTLTQVVLCKCNKLNLVTRKQYSNLSYIHNIGKDPLRPLTIGSLLEQSAEKYGSREALISKHQNRRLTFNDVLQQADRLAAGLRATGLEVGDRLGLWAPNMVEWYITKMACARAGLILVAINPAYQAPEMEYCINKVGIKAVVCAHKFKTQNFYEILNEISSDIPHSHPGKIYSSKIPSLQTVITISEEKLSGTFKFNEILDLADDNSIKNIRDNHRLIRFDDGCNIQFTSGTTGKPKAALVSHFQLVNNSYEVGKRNELNVKHHTICVQVPFFHAFGLDITIMAALNFGATLVVPGESYNPVESLVAIKEENCTTIHGTPTMYVDLIRVQKEKNEKISPEIAVCGGAPCSPHLFKQMLEVLKVRQVKSVYGLTETTAVVVHSHPGDNEYQQTSTVGKVGEHLEAKIVDENDRLVPFGSPGELCIRGYCNMLGYWGDEAKTQEMIGPDKWLKTGDQFVLQKDGYGTVVGRLKEMIIRGGENIFPKEIEDFLNSHPDIIETHVIGLSHERLGEEVCACIRIREGSTVTKEKVVEFCKGKIAHFKIPSKVNVVKEFPKTASGKIQKFKLKEQFEK